MIRTFHYTDKGPRANNEDSLEIKQNNEFVIACLSDGVGGENCGKLASEISVEYFVSEVNSINNDLKAIVLEAHEQIKKIQKEKKECKGMASTFTACVLNDKLLKGVHVGDTRLCILRNNGLKQLTDSHTEVYRLVKSGKIKSEDIETYPRKHILESALGILGELTVQNFEYTLEDRDRILITSDGVHDIISKSEFRDLSIMNIDLNSLGNAIIGLLKQKKLRDNVSFIVIEI